MNNISFAKDLYLYTGSTFDGNIVIKDIHGKPYLISEGDEIILFIKKADPYSAESVVQLTLTYEDEVAGEYPFKLSPEETAVLNGDYIYSVFIRFADGDYYQIVPETSLTAGVPYGAVSYYENKNMIIAQVPRVMKDNKYLPALNELEQLIEKIESDDAEHLLYLIHADGADIMLIGNIADIDSITPDELVDRIEKKLSYFDAENYYISGFFHVDNAPELSEYYNAVKNAFGDRFINAVSILKTPVYAKNSETIISSIAFDVLEQRPKHDDILSIVHNEYPGYIINDQIHFNEKGCLAAAKVILKEVYNIG